MEDITNPYEAIKKDAEEGGVEFAALKILAGIMADYEDGLIYRQTAMTDDVGDAIVDTVKPSDTNKWETGILPHEGASWVIVEQYPNEETAAIGHQGWVETMRENPEAVLLDIYFADIFIKEIHPE